MEEKDQTIEGSVAEDSYQKTSYPSSSSSSSKLSPIRTYKVDIAEHVKNRNVSLIEAVAEETKRERTVAKNKKTIFMGVGIFAILGFIFLAILATGYYLYNEQADKNSEKEKLNASPPTSIILSDKTENVTVFSEVESFAKIQKSFLEDFDGFINGNLDLGLTKLSISKEAAGVKQDISSREFLKLIGANPPAILTDYIDSEFEFFNFSKFGEDWPVLLLKINARNYAYSGMLDWEKRMAADLGKVFQFASEGAGSFKDKVLQNRDARVLYTQDEDVALIYAFFGEKYLIITSGEESLLEMIKRFSSPRYFKG